MGIDITGTENYNNGPYQIPERKIDKGDDVYDIFESYFERMATHNHSGDDSKPLTNPTRKDVLNLTVGVDLTWQGIKNDGSVTAVPAEIVGYRATLNCHPSADSYDNNIRFHYFKDGADWKRFLPSTEKVSATSYYLYANEAYNEIKVTAI